MVHGDAPLLSCLINLGAQDEHLNSYIESTCSILLNLLHGVCARKDQ